MNYIRNLLRKLYPDSEKNSSYRWKAFAKGLIFHIDSLVLNEIDKGAADPWIMHQHVALKMLLEQGYAEEIPNGFIVKSEEAVKLDRATQDLLKLPNQWTGKIEADIQGVTGNSSFSISLKTQTLDGGFSSSYALKGPILKFSSAQQYILTPAQQIIFSSIEKHRSSKKSEIDNLHAIFALQEAKKIGANIRLGHFDSLDIKTPKSISVEAELDDAGNLILTPFMGQNASNERIQKVLGQLKSDRSTALRVDDEIILFNEQNLTAVHEILKNRVVPKDKIKQFLENPTAFIDASLVDLDLGFSARVHGATKFKHAYYGETDASGIDWFGANVSSASILPISKIPKYLDDSNKLTEFKARFDDAINVGAGELSFAGNVFDISDREAVSIAIEKIKNDIRDGKYPVGHTSESDNTSDSNSEKKSDVFVVDIDLNDEEINIPSPTLEKDINQILYPPNGLDWGNYLRKPFPHQDTGIRWILGLALAKKKFPGGLLADDMGLGKTYMALSAVDHLYKIYTQSNKIKKPCLIVAPLSLLQNWKDEVASTFSSSPFKDIIILQSEGDLRRFRIGGVETKQSDIDDKSEAEIRYALKVGKNFFQERLDLPQRLVITTYQTLRDYQFSLCRIDWGMNIFDEAQNIKNPNAYQTRAAKGLKAEFKLMVTGTPVENSLADFWCIFDTFYDKYLSSYQDFRKTYIEPILQAAGDEVEKIRGRVGRELRLKVGPLMLRRVKEDNLKGLPEKRIFVGIKEESWEYKSSLDTFMQGRQLETYNAALSAHDDSESNVITGAVHRLRNISLHPQLADEGQLVVPKNSGELQSLINESGKMQSIISTLDDIKKRQEKCIIFIVNKRLQAFLSLALGKRYNLGPLSVINGDTKAVAKKAFIPTRKSIIRDFENCEGFNIIIMSPIAAGVGLTIVGANNVIHLERHWNPAKEAQATDRVHRIGQTKEVNVYIPISHHPVYESFDVNLHKLLSNKTLLRDAVVTPEEVAPSPGGFGEGFTSPDQIMTADYLQRLSWQQFEAACAELFFKEYAASSCWLTPRLDYGADVVLKTGAFGKLVQCKHTKGVKYNSYSAILEIHSARPKYSLELNINIETLIFATNAKILSAETKKTAEQYNVQIYSYNEIAVLLEKHAITFHMILTRLGKNRLQVH